MLNVVGVPLEIHFLKKSASIVISKGIDVAILPNNRSCHALKDELRRGNRILPEILSLSELLNFPNITFQMVHFFQKEFQRQNPFSVPAFNVLYDLAENLQNTIKSIVLSKLDYRKLEVPDHLQESWAPVLALLDSIFNDSEIYHAISIFEWQMQKKFESFRGKNMAVLGLMDLNFYTRKLYEIANKHGVIIVSENEVNSVREILKIDSSNNNSCLSLDFFKGNIEKIELPTHTVEAMAVAVAVRRAFHENQKVLIVCPSRTLIEKIKSELQRWNITANESSGIPFYKTRAGQIFAQIISVIESDFSNYDVLSLLKFNSDFSPEIFDFESFLQDHSNYPKNFFETVKYFRSERQFFKTTFVVIDELQKFATTSEIGSFDFWLDYFFQFISLIDIEAAQKFLDVTRDLRNDVFEEIPKNEFCVFAKKHMLQISTRETEHYTSGVVILGILEAQLLDADLLILCDVNEDSWSAPQKDSLLISQAMMCRLGVQTADDQNEFYQRLWEKFTHKPNVLITRSELVNGEKPRAFAALQNMNIKNADWLEEIVYTLSNPEKSPALTIPKPCPPIEARPQHFWVSNLDVLVNNPYVFYAKKVLKLRELTRVNEPITVYGNWVHNILDVFVKNGGGNFNDLKKLADQCMSEMFLSIEDLGLQFFGTDEIFRLFLKEFHAEEVQSFPEIVGEINIEINGMSFRISAKADRIDLNNDGEITVIDYKTGTPPGINSVKSGTRPQLAIEALIASNDGFKIGSNKVSNTQFWQLKPRDCKVSKITSDEVKTSELCQIISEQIRALLQKYNISGEPYELNLEERRNWAYMHLARAKEICNAR